MGYNSCINDEKVFMFSLKITDELGFNHNFEFNSLKALRIELNKWLKNIDETPLYNIEINFEG
jgi:hypothetical protein